MNDDLADREAAKFDNRRPVYEGFKRRVHELLVTLLEHEDLDVIEIQSRVKGSDSFREKLVRKGKHYTDPLNEVTDLVGIRVVVYYQTDADTVDSVIRGNFDVDELNTYRRADTLRDEEFGYLSNHYVISIGESRRTLPEWQQYEGLKAEVQVRTALQHAWAAVDHKMNYKSPADIPGRIRRKMAMLSAIFELADEQFGLLRDERRQVRAEYSAVVGDPSVSLPLDDTSVSLLLEEDDLLGVIHEALSDADRTDWFSTEDRAFERVSGEQSSRSRAELLRLLRHLEISTVGDLRAILLSDRAKAVAALRALNSTLSKGDIVAPNVAEVIATWLMAAVGVDPGTVDYSNYPEFRRAVADVHGEVYR